MIGYIKGEVIDISGTNVIVDIQGLGYMVHTTLEQLNKMAIGKTVSFWIHTIVRETDISLYGFGNREESRMFDMLLGVSGIGPKSALAILSVAGLKTIEQAIQNADSSSLTKISGVGKKTADKIVLELGGKMPQKHILSNQEDADVFEALKSLGYRERDINEKIVGMPKDISGVNEKIKWVLKSIGK
jgi:Holliday junction DNA helicase RuvA